MLRVYIANRPKIQSYAGVAKMPVLNSGAVDQIVAECGNHWRKIFNCYAKIGFSLSGSSDSSCTSWQDYRDRVLLQEGSATELRFDRELPRDGSIKLIAGRTHATTFSNLEGMEWLDESFALSREERLIISPYFDYRQLSNAKLAHLVELIKSL